MKKIIHLTAVCLCVLCLLAACSDNKVKNSAPVQVQAPVDSAKLYQDSLKAEMQYIPTEDKLLHPSYNPEKLCGIGIFKIGLPVSIIDSVKKQVMYSEANNATILTREMISAMDSGKPVLIKKMRGVDISDSEGVGPDAEECPQATVYRFYNFNVNNILIKDMDLVFYKERLVSIDVHWAKKLVADIETKYGHEADAYKDKKIDKHSETLINGDVVATLSTSGFIGIAVRGAKNVIRQCVEEQLKLIQQQQSGQKEKLKDF